MSSLTWKPYGYYRKMKMNNARRRCIISKGMYIIEAMSAVKHTLGNNFPHFHVQFGAGMLLCEVGQQYGVIPHIGISSCLVVRGVFPQTRYVLG
jgi:hypothetical protein